MFDEWLRVKLNEVQFKIDEQVNAMLAEVGSRKRLHRARCKFDSFVLQFSIMTN